MKTIINALLINLHTIILLLGIGLISLSAFLFDVSLGFLVTGFLFIGIAFLMNQNN